MDSNGRNRTASTGSNISLPTSSTFRRLAFRRDKGVTSPSQDKDLSNSSASPGGSVSLSNTPENNHQRVSTFPSLSLKRDEVSLSSSLYGLNLGGFTAGNNDPSGQSTSSSSHLAPPFRTSSLPPSPNVNNIIPDRSPIPQSSVPLQPPLSAFPRGVSRAPMMANIPPLLPSSNTFVNLSGSVYEGTGNMIRSPSHTPTSSYNTPSTPPVGNNQISPVPGHRSSSRQRDFTAGLGVPISSSGMVSSSSNQRLDYQPHHAQNSGSGSGSGSGLGSTPNPSSPLPGSGGPPTGVPRRVESIQFPNTSRSTPSTYESIPAHNANYGSQITRNSLERPGIDRELSGNSSSSAGSSGVVASDPVSTNPVVQPGSHPGPVNPTAGTSIPASTEVQGVSSLGPGPMSSVLNLPGGSGSGSGAADRSAGPAEASGRDSEESDDITVRRRRATDLKAPRERERGGDPQKESERERSKTFDGAPGRDEKPQQPTTKDRDRSTHLDKPKKLPHPNANPPPKTLPKLPSSKQIPYAPPSSMYFSLLPTHGTPPPQPLRAHTGTLVGNKIWFIGGVDQKICWRGVGYLDTETMAWRGVDTFGEVLPGLRAHTTTLVGERLLYVFGGGDGPNYSNEVWVFDTVTHRFSKPHIATPRTSLPLPRRAHTTVLYRSYLIIFGGGNGQAALNDVWALDVSDPTRLTWHEWRTKGDVPGKKGYHSANLVGDRMVVFGGSDGHASFADVHVLNLKTLTWTLINTEIRHNRLSHTSTQVGSYLFIIGGHNGQSYAQDVLLFNLVTLAWESKVPRGIPPPGRGYHVSLLCDARIFISGGYNGVNVFDDLWVLDLSAGAYLPQVTTFEVDETAEHVKMRSAEPILIPAR